LTYPVSVAFGHLGIFYRERPDLYCRGGAVAEARELGVGIGELLLE
jgi:hypothetical protein